MLVWVTSEGRLLMSGDTSSGILKKGGKQPPNPPPTPPAQTKEPKPPQGSGETKKQ